MEIIRPCKHCGGVPAVVGRKKVKVVCTKCGASGAEKPLRSEAIQNWNSETITRCINCRYYHPKEKWCDIYSFFEDENGNPVDDTNSTRYLAFSPDDYCSNAKKNEQDG